MSTCYAEGKISGCSAYEDVSLVSTKITRHISPYAERDMEVALSIVSHMSSATLDIPACHMSTADIVDVELRARCCMPRTRSQPA